MVFSSLLFLFFFLPLVILGALSCPRRYKNGFLLIGSLVFYWWGTQQLWFLILVSILIDYICGSVQVRTRNKGTKTLCLWISIICNLGILSYFKYTKFFISNFNSLAPYLGGSAISVPDIILPIGISFYTFQTISYQLDLYRGIVQHQRNFIDFSLFVALFPQLVAGPIVRYREIQRDLHNRVVSLDDFSYGSVRFIVGLGKKVLLADQLAVFSDYAFAAPPQALTLDLAWLGAITFALQIYYDFSGYSDMAIGLGRMLGFHFPENFNYPYIARSLGELWTRWHMSLMRWFRDYVLWALKKLSPTKATNNFNLIFVFLLCGFWHGANWHFIAWGATHGLLLVVERKWLGKLLRRAPVIFQHWYVLFIWIALAPLFRCRSLSAALVYLKAMFYPRTDTAHDALYFINFSSEYFFILMAAIFGCLPVVPFCSQLFSRLHKPLNTSVFDCVLRPAQLLLASVSLSLLVLYSIATIVSSSKNPFLYFQF